MITYAARNMDLEQLKKSASGGVATGISTSVINQGGAVIGVAYSSDFMEADYTLVDNYKDLEKLYGSKYIRPRTKFNEICTLIDNGMTGKYKLLLVIGLPCIISILKKKYENSHVPIFFCDLICHGVGEKIVHQEFIKSLNRKYNSRVVALNTRAVKRNWKNPQMVVAFENRKKYKKRLYSTEYGFSFLKYTEKPCCQCKFKGDNHNSDITIGDLWGDFDSLGIYDSLGMSLIICHTIKGVKLLDMSKGNLLIEAVNAESAIKSNPTYSRAHTNPNIDICEIVKCNGIKGIRKVMSIKERIRASVRFL